MHYIVQAQNIIRTELARLQLNEKQLAARSGVDQSTINRFMRAGTEDVRFDTLQRIACALDLSVSQLIGEAPIEADRQVRAVVAAMRSMPDYMKDAVVEVSATLSQRATAQHTEAAPTPPHGMAA